MRFGNEAIPQTIVIDPDGRIISHWDGYAVKHSGDHLRAVLENVLGKTEVSERGAGAVGRSSSNALNVRR